MRWRPLKILALLSAGSLVGLLLVLMVMAHPHQIAPVQFVSPVPTVAALPAQTYMGLPVRLKIAALGIDTAIEYMGTTANGDMAVPGSSSDVGWYKYSTIPGELGSAVIAGHVVGDKGQPGVFSNLNKLLVGDAITVIDAKGQSVTFSVRQTETYGQSQSASQIFDSQNGIHLNLITCAGEWDASTHHYLDRLVVFADKSD